MGDERGIRLRCICLGDAALRGSRRRLPGVFAATVRLRNLGLPDPLSRSLGLVCALRLGSRGEFRGCLRIIKFAVHQKAATQNNEPKTQTTSDSTTNRKHKTAHKNVQHVTHRAQPKDGGSAQSPAVARGYTTHGAERAQERGSPRHTPLLNLLDNAGPCQGAVRSGVALALGLMIGPPFSDPLRWETELALCDLGSVILRSGQLGPVAASSRRRLCARR